MVTAPVRTPGTTAAGGVTAADGAAPDGSPGAAAGAAPARLAVAPRSGWEVVRRRLAGSPGRLRLLGIAGVVAGLLVSVGGGLSLRAQADALAEARAATAHLVLLRGVSTELVRADANATNAFLRGGLEPTERRAEYLAALSRASRDLAVAARSGIGDGAPYGRASEDLSRYAGRIEAARSTNRQGKAVGANYLRIGSDELRAELLPQLSGLAANDTRRVDAAHDRFRLATLGFVLCAVAGLVLLGVVQYRLAHLTRSIFTVPAAATGALLAVVLLVTGVLCAVAFLRAGEVRDGDARRTDALARARTAAFDAKALESLTLSARGSRPDGEEEWAAAMSTARDELRAGGGDLRPLEEYAGRHREIADLDRDGRWPEAVAQAVATGAGTANEPFDRFDDESRTLLGDVASGAHDGLGSARAPLTPAAIAVALAGLLAAAGLARGIADRLGEYR
jgi:hypothetical protein